MHQYKLISKKGEGTFSEVLKAQSLKTGNYVAIKCMKNQFSSIEQVNHLREIQALRKLSPHENIIKLIEILYDEPTGRLALVFELMDKNMYEHIKGRKQFLNQQKVKYYMFQLIKAVEHMHRNGIFHRDIKPENILLLGESVKLADFGSCKGMYSQHPYTEYISTRWYRPPECLLTDGYYNYKMDIWGVGCVMFEIISLFPLFPGNDELDQINKIHNILGTPNKEILKRFQKQATHMQFDFPEKQGTGIKNLMSHISKDCLDLVQAMLQYDPNDRITAVKAMQHEYFREMREMDQMRDLDVTLQSSLKFKVDHENFQKTQLMNYGDQNNEKAFYPALTQKKQGYQQQQQHQQQNIPIFQQKKNQNQKKISSKKFEIKELKVDHQKNEQQFEYQTDDEANDPNKQEKVQVSTLPPIKNPNMDANYKANQKKEEMKKIYGNLFKPSIQTQQLIKKNVKKSNISQGQGDYMIYGKKALGI